MLENINEGFETKNGHLIYKSLLDVLNYKDDICFQKHPLGFAFLNLGKLSANTEFRLHVWDSRFMPQNIGLQIHNHSFDFESFVIAGKIKNTIYSINENINSDGILYQVKFVDNKSILDLKGDKFEIIIDSEKSIEVGSFYKLNKDEFHETENMLDFSVTILKMVKPLLFNPPLIFSTKKINSLRAFSRSQLNQNKHLEIVRKVIKVCENVIHFNND